MNKTSTLQTDNKKFKVFNNNNLTVNFIAAIIFSLKLGKIYFLKAGLLIYFIFICLSPL